MITCHYCGPRYTELQLMDRCVRVCEPRQRGFCPFEWRRITWIYTEHVSWAIPRSWSHWTSKLCQIRCSFTKTPHLGSLTVVDLIRKGCGGFSGPNPGNPASVADFNTRRCMRRCAHQASSSQNFKWPVSKKSNRNLRFFLRHSGCILARVTLMIRLLFRSFFARLKTISK